MASGASERARAFLAASSNTITGSFQLPVVLVWGDRPCCKGNAMACKARLSCLKGPTPDALRCDVQRHPARVWVWHVQGTHGHAALGPQVLAKQGLATCPCGRTLCHVSCSQEVLPCLCRLGFWQVPHPALPKALVMVYDGVTCCLAVLSSPRPAQHCHPPRQHWGVGLPHLAAHPRGQCIGGAARLPWGSGQPQEPQHLPLPQVRVRHGVGPRAC